MWRPGAATIEPPAARKSVAIAGAVAMEPVTIEEDIVHKDPAAEPVGTPAPSAPAESAEVTADANSIAEGESEFRIIQRRVIAINRRTPDIRGIVHRHVHHFRVGRLD